MNHKKTRKVPVRVHVQLFRGWVGGVSRSPDGLFAQQEREPIRGRPAVRGKRTYGGRPGQRVEEQGTWASRTQKHSEAGYGRPMDRGAWTAKTVNDPSNNTSSIRQLLTRKRHIPPHSAQPQHTNDWAPRTQKRHQQEHRPQRPTERSDPTQHAKGRTGDCPGPRKGTATQRNVTRGGAGQCTTASGLSVLCKPPPACACPPVACHWALIRRFLVGGKAPLVCHWPLPSACPCTAITQPPPPPPRRHRWRNRNGGPEQRLLGGLHLRKGKGRAA